MANILAAQNGLWSASTTWTGGVAPGAGDVAVANGFIVTIDQEITCQALRADGFGGAADGGYFVATSGITIHADVYASNTDSGLTLTTLDVGNTANVIVDGTCYGNDAGPGSLLAIPTFAAGTPGAPVTGLRIKATVAGAYGMPAVLAPFSYIASSTASAKVRATSGLTEITLRTKAFAGVLPAESDVKSGTVYGDGDYTGYLSGSSTRAGQLLMTAPMSGSNAASAGSGSMPASILLDDTDTPLIADDDGYTLTTED